jgi:hypothetical protein
MHSGYAILSLVNRSRRVATTEELEDVVISRPVPGLGALHAGLLPKPYPINIYMIDGDDTSGIAGTLFPDGTFKPLSTERTPRPVRWWDEDSKQWIDGICSWDGCVNGSLELGMDGDTPHRRVDDPNDLLGQWPLEPPRPTPVSDMHKESR